MAIPKHEYIMDYIDDPDIYKAVMFARQMIRDGSYASNAIRKAAYTYKVDMTEVAKYVGQSGGRKASETPKTRKRKPKQVLKEKFEYWIMVENIEMAHKMTDLINAINYDLRVDGLMPSEEMRDSFAIYARTEKMVKRMKGVFVDYFLTIDGLSEIALGIRKVKRNSKGELTCQSIIL